MTDFVEPTEVLRTRCRISDKEGCIAPEDAGGFRKEWAWINENPNPVRTIVGVAHETFKLGDTAVMGEDCISITNLQDGGKPDRETAHEKPR